MVYGPLIGGVALFGLFLYWESRYRHAMLELDLFKVRNFAVTNLETLVVYAGLIGAFFFVTLFLQETAGYTPLQAGFATTPISLMLFALSPLFGKFSTGIGPRVPMSVGPVVAGIGLLMLSRAGAHPDYVADILPGVLVFGLGLSATVAPLTATALNSVPERHAGAASGINNGVARVAGLLAIAILGALISGQFGSSIDDKLEGAPLSAAGQRAIDDAKARPLGGGPDQRRGRLLFRGGLPARARGRRAADDRRGDPRRDRASQPAARGKRGATRPAGELGRRMRTLQRSRPKRRRRPRERPRVDSRRDEDLQRHPADRAQAPRQLHRRDPPVRRGPGPRRPGDLLHRRPARDHGFVRPAEAARERL
jgi:hypothetical protein